ncbi:glycosyltransferase [Xylanibacter ruminicola]|uniref:Glycosyltransferase, group 1 family n=1 Tax=Xylanibacter ruminicola (strain ATCC 19189 / DSM 19721 / CIP 105475 / JCM 8958 / 23) TaxID=264731 RepID=D5ETV2_XYLR2|nr:glycosyltransferase [Xylanibacter ruminicola]ADE83322.1 glycosyltransferase, group 1 family [Xylanibacter ruminicola 23]
MRKLVYIGFPFEHHKGTHAGYHQIADYVDYDVKIDCSSFIEHVSRKPKNIFDRIFRHVVWKFTSRPVIPWFLLKCIILGIKRNDVTFHFIYGENIYYNIKPFIRKGNKIVCTLHQPLEWFQNNLWKKRLKSMDEVVLVGKSELDGFRELVSNGIVTFIPHGIRTDFYCPDSMIKKERMLLTVGNWLRDYEFADKVYQQLLKQDSELKIVVVAMPKRVECLTKDSRIQCLSGISDDELRDLYQRCSVLFLPLKRYTANNSLLEASACGCNIVISSDFQDNSYIPEQYVSLCPMKVEASLSSIIRTMSSETNTPLATFIQKNYSWENVGDNLTRRYKNT